MSRAEMRRKSRVESKSKTATYNLTKAQLDALVQERFGELVKEAKLKATEDALNTAMTLLLTLPLEVLMDHYWPKTYQKKIPEFTEHLLEYYSRWQDGEFTIEELQEDLWTYAGVRLVESER